MNLSCDLYLVALFGLLGLLEGAVRSRQKKGVVFGGTGFVGSATVKKLIQSGDNITVINRGTPYWDSKSNIFPNVTHLQYDRLQNLSHFQRVDRFLRFNAFDYVIDFSANDKFAIEQTTEALKGNVDLYILISKDSVYEVCENEEFLNEAVKETDAVRVPDPEIRKELEERHRSSHRKLSAEETLIEKGKTEGLPYVIFRLPDVIGPRDTTYDWVTYQLWAKVSSVLKDIPITVPEFLTVHNMSLVYVEDVASTILKIRSSEIKNEVFNLAWKQFFHLDSVLKTMLLALELDENELQVAHPDENVHYFYPGATSPPLDVAKAQKEIQWQPTPFEIAVKETVQFHEQVMVDQKFIKQRDEIIQHVAALIYPNDKLRFYKALEKLYNINLYNFTKRHDEL